MKEIEQLVTEGYTVKIAYTDGAFVVTVYDGEEMVAYGKDESLAVATEGAWRYTPERANLGQMIPIKWKEVE